MSMWSFSEVPEKRRKVSKWRKGSVRALKESVRLMVSASTTFSLPDNFPSGNKPHMALTLVENSSCSKSPGSAGQVV